MKKYLQQLRDRLAHRLDNSGSTLPKGFFTKSLNKYSRVTEPLYKQIKNDLKAKKSSVVYTTNKKIGERYGFSAVSVGLIAKSRSFAHYKQLRNSHSQPKKYEVKK